MNIGIIGRTHLLVETAKKLVAKGHKIVFVYTCQAESYYQAKESDFEKLAAELGCPFFNDLDVHLKIELLKKLNADVCVSINWRSMLGDQFLGAFRHGVLSAHAGDLPRYKGNACPNWAILNFEKQITLTIHKMTAELDSGPYVTKLSFPIDEKTYITEVYQWLENIVPRAFAEAISKIDTTEFIEQDKQVRTLRTYPRRPEDSRILWTQISRNVLALIRASSRPFEGAYCFLNNSRSKKLVIFKATDHSVDFDYFAIPGQVCFSSAGSPVIATGDGLIKIEECFFLHEANLDAKREILKSLRNRLT